MLKNIPVEYIIKLRQICNIITIKAGNKLKKEQKGDKMLKYLFENIRVDEQPKCTGKQIVIQICTSFIIGTLLGIIAKYSDTVTSNGSMGVFFHPISIITTRLGMWVFLATIIAAWSKSPKIAAVRVFTLFIGVLLAYYIYSQVLFGFFPTYYFLRWGGIAVFSPLLAYMMWFSRGKGPFAVFCASLPIGLLLEQGYPLFFHVFSVGLLFDILTAILLLIILPKQKVQCLKIAALGILIAFIFRNSHILSYFFGGL